MKSSKWFIMIFIFVFLITVLSLWANIFNNSPDDVVKQYLNVVSSYLSDINTRKSNAVAFGYDQTYAKSYVKASVIDLLEDLKPLLTDYNRLKSSLKEFYTGYVEYSAQASDLCIEILNYSYLPFNEIHYPEICNDPFLRLKLEYIYYSIELTSDDMTIVDRIGNNSWRFRLKPVRSAIEENYRVFLLFPQKHTQIPLKGFEKPRFYYLRRTFKGWKIDWLKTMKDLILAQ